jgi:pyruvate dehydrogenase E2 component (dihydrolipoamide acetyltransferase)
LAFELRLPDIGEGLTEAEVVDWLVAVGQEVELDQPLVQVETDKAVTDIPAPKAGVLLVQGAPIGSAVKVGEILAVIGRPGEQLAASLEQSTAGIESGRAAPIVGTLREAEEVQGLEIHQTVTAGDTRALPLVLKLARELGVDLDSIQGTGPKGRITREDVESAARGTAQPPTVEGPGGPGERVRLSRLRRTIAERMARSWREIPHVTTFGEADATRVLAVRGELADSRGRPIPMEALFVKAVVPALRVHPELNASLDGEELVLKRRCDVGIAVDTPDGLIVPVVRRAEERDFMALADEIERLSEAARNRSVRPEDLAGATFTITNIGAVGGGYGTPIIPYGTTAILSFGRAREKPVARDGQVVIAPMMPLSLSYDHRVIDGALGRRFLAVVIQHLEEAGVT